MSWVVYILKCADGSLYTGITNNLDRRVAEHSLGSGAKYTRGRGPFGLVYQEICKDRSEASKRESQIKAMPRKRKAELLGLITW
jgi:putative endonuclease